MAPPASKKVVQSDTGDIQVMPVICSEPASTTSAETVVVPQRYRKCSCVFHKDITRFESLFIYLHFCIITLGQDTDVNIPYPTNDWSHFKNDNCQKSLKLCF